MGKKVSAQATKSAAKAAKKAKAAQKTERKEKKKVSKSKTEDARDDLEAVLEQMRMEWEAAHSVTEELAEGPPTRRAGATLTPCPSGNYLWCIGGEYYSEDGKAYFYNDVLRYSPDKNEWRKFVSPICPGPRSAHAVAASPAGGGRLFLFGGEFSSLHQNTFHHYRDFWCFDTTSHSWDRIETKVRPSARSGHRMAMWKHYVVLFGGFYDPGITTRYLNDLWLFNTQEYKWQQIEFGPTERRPSPRSGFSFLSTTDGIVLHGGYCKEYAKGKRPIGVMLDDTWFLRMSLNTDKEGNSTVSVPPTLKWERRKRPSTAYAPSLRSGCTMALWAHKDMGILFGGVTDEDTNEETLESVFWNDLYGYQLAGNGRWLSLSLKKPKQKGSGKKVFQLTTLPPASNEYGAAEDLDDDQYTDNSKQPLSPKVPGVNALAAPSVDPDDPSLSMPMARYNAMLAVVRNTLYIYGGIYERGSREYTLDDFYSLQLDKMDRYVCLKKSEVVIAENDGSSSSGDDSDSNIDEEDEDDEQEEEDSESGATSQDHAEAEKSAQHLEHSGVDDVIAEAGQDELAAVRTLRGQATAFLGVSKDSSRLPEDVKSTPLPGETLAVFYARSREYWANQAHSTSGNRGKSMRRDGFALAEERYAAYKPILQEVEKILAEAGLDEEEMKRPGGQGGLGEGSRHRR